LGPVGFWTGSSSDGLGSRPGASALVLRLGGGAGGAPLGADEVLEAVCWGARGGGGGADLDFGASKIGAAADVVAAAVAASCSWIYSAMKS
jgi:hypothetical protein